jgi:RimJ/RimL family protein N-acetyltransferase
MQIALANGAIRSWHARDAAAIVRHANNRKIWLNLRDRFPFPYTIGDAHAYLRHVRQTSPETFFAITVDDAPVGSIGFVLQQDVERVSAEVGYWLGEDFWGRGLATHAVRAITRYAVEHHYLTRLFALPFAHNVASCRVLEKAGYVLEAQLRRSAIKDGVVVDQRQYAWYAPE